MSFVLSCSSTADMPKAYFEQRDIHYICFHFQLDGKEMMDDLGQTMPFEAFYQAMRDGANTSTSQISPGEYEEYFESFLKEGKDVLHLSLSSGISGTVQSAMMAMNTLKENYPERKIIVLDSTCASVGYGLIMDILADMRDSGKSIEEAAAWAEKNRTSVHHWFYTGDLTYLIRGGRVSKAAGIVGQLLSICPLMRVNRAGALVTFNKIRTKRKAMLAAAEQMELHAVNGKDYTGKIFIGHSDCEEDAKALGKELAARFPKNSGFSYSSIGTTIGSHTGPGLVVVCYMGDERAE